VIEVRPAGAEDAREVVRVHEEASAQPFEELVGRTFGDVFPLDARLEQQSARLDAARSCEGTLVAELDGVVVGMAAWCIGDDGAGELEDLHVVPSAWGTGVAQELLRSAVSALDDAGSSSPFLWVGEDNARARRFYEREGWTYDGTRERSSLEPMQLRYRLSALRPPAST
jgi:GNAT superfamily N-acetyltransferase